MLGCHDFCGYYEWTFHYVRRRFGRRGLEKYWAEAIASDSQLHYIAAAKEKGLRGLYEAWSKTGGEENCDWSVTLDEEQNLVRLDMRQCPSKGFLLDNHLNADEDYCDHCIGWIAPALDQAEIEVAGHEHNHCGQCWWEIRATNADQPPVQVGCDIRQDPRWSRGYLDRFTHNDKLPVIDQSAVTDPCERLVQWFRDAKCLAVLGRNASQEDIRAAREANAQIIVSGRVYASDNPVVDRVHAVVLEHDPALLAGVAERFHSSEHRPLLLHAYLPHEPFLSFADHGLPRAAPMLPILIRTGLYTHDSARTQPGIYSLAVLLAAALEKRVLLRGINAAAHSQSTGSSAELTKSDLEWIEHAVRHGLVEIDFPLPFPT